MKANKTLLAIATLIAVSFSCKKSDSAPVAPAATPKTVLATVNYSAVGSYSYTYDADGKLQTETYGGNPSNPPSVNTIKNYDSKGRVVEYAASFSTSPASNYKAVIAYDDNGKMERKQTYDASGNNIGYVNYQYATGKVTVKRYSASNTLQQSEEYTLSADGNNVTSYKVFNGAGTLLSTTDYSNYDTKKGTDALYPYGYYDYPTSQNNYQALSRTTASTGAVTSYTVIYTYNDDGYPLKRTNSTGSTIDYAYLKK